MARKKDRCGVDGCRRARRGVKPCCDAHWLALPEVLRTNFWNAHSAAHEDSPRLLSAVAACLAHLDVAADERLLTTGGATTVEA